ncbi:putative metallophosphoesterase YkuE [Dictyobacter alpinus]|uniref:Putative metallophosphoesterase YkuE n=1 Tax=Dictyobacter alpinus TaxID=2014873 RepID=A0A402B518_9CHLR|nr:metallophosphoesterase [Dictyobacter alpinus]GCE26441.1 putative metallophosphoesterase YkuE [Dictyobacter alpinus]
MRRRIFLRNTLATLAATVAVGGGTVIYAGSLEPAWLDIHYQPVVLPRLHPVFDGYRVAHITDLHTDETFMTAERLSEVVQVVNAQDADLILITGDFVTHFLASSATTLAELRHLHARDGVFAVLGNHDHWANPEQIRAILCANHIHELNDAWHTIDRGGGNAVLQLVGMDDLWSDEGVGMTAWTHESRFMRLLKAVPGRGAALLMVHEPDFADVTATHERIDLQLSGHSHGGQVRLPFFGSLQLPPLAHRYPAGMYQIGHLQHYTNRGIGMVPPQFRLNCRPEVAVFELRAPARH